MTAAVTMAIHAGALLLATIGGQSGAGAAAGMAAQPGQAMHDAPATCPLTPPPLPAAYRGWTTMTPRGAGTDAAGAPTLPLGAGTLLALHDAAAVRFAVAPGHAPAAGSSGGLATVAVSRAGRYRVALGGGAWIDLVRNGTPLASIGHGHGPACTTVKKTVDFDLQPGRYLLQLSGSTAPVLAVMVAPAE
jgi:hypothetical protein